MTQIPRLVIVVDGGLVQQVLSDVPLSIVLINYDEELFDRDDLSVDPSGNKVFIANVVSDVDSLDIDEVMTWAYPELRGSNE